MDLAQLLQATSSSIRGASGRRNHPINFHPYPYPLDEGKAINSQIMTRRYAAAISPQSYQVHCAKWRALQEKQSQPYLRCVEEEEVKYVLEEVHGGIYDDHMGAKSLVRKIIRADYFWPTMQQDAVEFIRKCDSCQRYGNVQQVQGEKMTVITLPWSFA